MNYSVIFLEVIQNYGLYVQRLIFILNVISVKEVWWHAELDGEKVC